jgi:hypothetical protein
LTHLLGSWYSSAIDALNRCQISVFDSSCYSHKHLKERLQQFGIRFASARET